MTINKSFLNRVIATLVIGAIAIMTIQIQKIYGNKVAALVVLLVLLVSIINRVIRHFSWSKSFISSKLNLYTTKYHTSLIVNLPVEIAYGKFVEVMNESKFKIQKISESNFEIYALTGLKWGSIGENIYIKFENSKGATRLVFSSVSFKIFDMESNHNNLIDLINEFENSLTI